VHSAVVVAAAVLRRPCITDAHFTIALRGCAVRRSRDEQARNQRRLRVACPLAQSGPWHSAAGGRSGSCGGAGIAGRTALVPTLAPARGAAVALVWRRPPSRLPAGEIRGGGPRQS